MSASLYLASVTVNSASTLQDNSKDVYESSSHLKTDQKNIKSAHRDIRREYIDINADEIALFRTLIQYYIPRCRARARDIPKAYLEADSKLKSISNNNPGCLCYMQNACCSVISVISASGSTAP